MKRSKTVQLLIISTTPFYLTACNQDYTTKTVTNTYDYPSIQACLDAKQDAQVCAKAYSTMRQIEQQHPVRYTSLDKCLEDFPSQNCEGDDNNAMAKAAGFQLLITKQQWTDKSGNPLLKDPRNFGSWSHKDLAEPQYAVKPLYIPKDGRTPSNLIAATENLQEQQQTNSSNSVASGGGSHYIGGYYGGYSGLGRSFTSSQSSFQPEKRTNSTVRRYASSTSRGGFGGYSSHSSSSRSFFGS